MEDIKKILDTLALPLWASLSLDYPDKRFYVSVSHLEMNMYVIVLDVGIDIDEFMTNISDSDSSKIMKFDLSKLETELNHLFDVCYYGIDAEAELLSGMRDNIKKHFNLPEPLTKT